MKFALKSWHYIIAGLAQGVEFTLKVNCSFCPAGSFVQLLDKVDTSGCTDGNLRQAVLLQFWAISTNMEKEAFLNQ